MFTFKAISSNRGVFMIDQLELIWIGGLFLFSLVLLFKQYKKVGYSFIVSFLLLFATLLKEDIEFLTEYEDIIVIIKPSLVIVVILTYQLFGAKKHKDKSTKELKKELSQTEQMYEVLRERFVSTIELFENGLCFQEDDDMSFGTDRFIEIIGLKSNVFSTDEFMNLIHKDDLYTYQEKIEKLTKRNPIYTIKYRVKKDNKFQWIFEQGKLVNINKKNYRISYIKRLDPLLFPSTEIELLNNLKKKDDLLEIMRELSKKKAPYYLIVFELSNIIKINEKFGRDIGDLMMSEYISKIQFRFLKDTNYLYRLEGIKFAFILEDKFKFDLLKRGLQGTGELINFSMEFGGIKQKIYPTVGIAESPYEGKKYHLVYEEALSNLKLATVDEISNSF